ncbi:MAG: hypothetical protein B7C24_11875 [Bacteroidetes bacterium 4572_77]|nr:MAG: hypothetical protein B7C24_11875 [Bacteroidetes bacterium 4572_77]
MKKQAEKFFSKTEEAQILDAIRYAENETSGELRVHVENHCKGDVLERAAIVFDLLKMQKTKLRNGVLFYLAVKDNKMAVLGDGGINAKVKDDFWDEIKTDMLTHFKQQQFAKGLTNGILKAGDQLKTHFPNQGDEDINELPDDISYA